MASTGNKPINVNHDFASGAKIKNLPAATTSGEAVEYSQFNSALFFKQGLISGGDGVDVTNSTVSVDLASAGSGYDSLNLTGMSFASLDGTYTKLGIKGRVNLIGDQLDLTYGDLDSDWIMYEKDNGSGVYALVVVRAAQNDYTTSSSWIAVLTTFSLAGYSYSGSGTATLAPLVASLSAVDNEVITSVSDANGSGDYVPDEADSNVAYGAAAAAAGLKFSNAKLSVDWANTVGDATTTRVFPSSVVKSYIDQEIVGAKDLSDHPFTNTTAQLTGSPNNAQSAIEACAAEIDTLDSQVSAIQTVNATQDAYLADHEAVLGVATGADSLSAFTGSAATFVGSSGTVQGSFQTVGDSIGAVYTNIGTINGLAAFETDFGTGFVILPNNSDAKSLFQATETELQNLSQGLGQFWNPIAAVEADVNINLNNPGTDVFGGTTVVQGDIVLLAAQTAAPKNGLYVFDTSSTAMVRATIADVSAEFSPNKTVQILATGDTWAYTGIDDPTLETTDLTFSKKTSSVIADASITLQKFGTTLTTAFNAKTDKYAETVTFVAGTPQNVTHGLNSTDVIVQCRDTSGNVTDMEIDITDSGFVTINSPYVSGDFRIVVIG